MGFDAFPFHCRREKKKKGEAVDKQKAMEIEERVADLSFYRAQVFIERHSFDTN